MHAIVQKHSYSFWSASIKTHDTADAQVGKPKNFKVLLRELETAKNIPDFAMGPIPK